MTLGSFRSSEVTLVRNSFATRRPAENNIGYTDAQAD